MLDQLPGHILALDQLPGHILTLDKLPGLILTLDQLPGHTLTLDQLPGHILALTYSHANLVYDQLPDLTLRTTKDRQARRRSLSAIPISSL